jgi:hypothetical protein
MTKRNNEQIFIPKCNTQVPKDGHRMRGAEDGRVE